MIGTDVVSRLTVEAAMNVPKTESTVPDSPEVTAWRAKIAPEVAAIRARGMSVDAPYEI